MEEVEAVRIKKIGVISFANTFAIINLIVGLIFGLFFGLLNLLISSVLNNNLPGNISLSFGFVGILFFIIGSPISFGIIGWINGAIFALLYNLSSKFTKGIQLYA
jgi:hypothetical protein